MPDCPALADIATSPTLAAEVEVDRIPELRGERSSGCERPDLVTAPRPAGDGAPA